MLLFPLLDQELLLELLRRHEAVLLLLLLLHVLLLLDKHLSLLLLQLLLHFEFLRLCEEIVLLGCSSIHLVMALGLVLGHHRVIFLCLGI